jgi:hypothetical protein
MESLMNCVVGRHAAKQASLLRLRPPVAGVALPYQHGLAQRLLVQSAALLEPQRGLRQKGFARYCAASIR